MKFIILLLILAGVIAVTVYVYSTYGGKPITEIPAWALLFFK